ncbi:MAG: hypothetical protein SWK90_02350 [Chloroflexota bacterium]|nr:hypothetical protein [Chloroflexota bacterium]
MTASQDIRRRDRWADLTVFALVAAALILGWALREAILFRTVSFTIAEAGISGRCPATWVRETGDDPLLRVRDPLDEEFNTVLELRSRPLAPEAEPAMVLDALALERAGQVTAYQPLDTDQVLVGGKTATRRTFTYVYVDRNPYVNRLPVVVRGTDLALCDGGRIIIVTLLAGGDNFEPHHRHFHTLVESLEF